MAVIILHPSEELKLINFQKELISELFTEDRILVAAMPLWIQCTPVVKPVETTAEHETSEVCGSFDTVFVLLNHRNIKSIEFEDVEISEKEVFIPVTITTENAQYNSKLTLVILHKGRDFTGFDRQKVLQKKQPVRQIKIFRLGIEKELSSNSKCITESKWVKIK